MYKIDFRAIPRHRIGRVLVDTPAYRAQLRVGDRVLAVNDISIDDLPHEQIVDCIRKSGQRLQLLVSLFLAYLNDYYFVKDNSNFTMESRASTWPLGIWFWPAWWS